MDLLEFWNMMDDLIGEILKKVFVKLVIWCWIVVVKIGGCVLIGVKMVGKGVFVVKIKVLVDIMSKFVVV